MSDSFIIPEIMKSLTTKCERCGGDFLTRTIRDSVCPDCLEKEAQEKEMARRREQIKQVLPKRFWALETDRKDLLKALYPGGAYIWGPVGTGKSVLAASLAKKYIMDGHLVKWVSFPSFILELQSAYRKESGPTPYDLAEDLAKFYGVLILDDIGAEKPTEFVRQTIYYILNEREQNEEITIITSNLSVAELNEVFDSRVGSRIMGMCKVVKLTGRDRRLERRAR